MKKIFKYIIPCLTIATVFVSCKDEDDSKRYIDNLYQTGTTTEIESTVAPVVADYKTASFTASLNDIEDVVECGFQVATSEDFSDAVSYQAEIDSVAKTFSATAEDLEGSTTYYTRSYVVTEAGGTIYGETQTITTPRVPIYTIDNTFLVHELAFNSDDGVWEIQTDDDGNDVGYYLIKIEFAEGSTTDLLLTNLWGFEETIAGTWDEESQTATFEDMQIIGNHSRYGEIFFRGVNDGITAYTGSLTLQFTPMGGLIASNPFQVRVAAGSFGFFRIDGQVYEDGEDGEE